MKIFLLIAVSFLLGSCYKKKHSALTADFALNKQMANIGDTIELTDYSTSRNVEVDFGDGSGFKNISKTHAEKHVYLTTGIFQVSVTAYEHVGGFHPHKAISKVAIKQITIN